MKEKHIFFNLSINRLIKYLYLFLLLNIFFQKTIKEYILLDSI